MTALEMQISKKPAKHGVQTEHKKHYRTLQIGGNGPPFSEECPFRMLGISVGQRPLARPVPGTGPFVEIFGSEIPTDSPLEFQPNP